MKPFEQHIKRNSLGMNSNAEIILDIVKRLETPSVMEVLGFSVSNKVATQATIHKELKWLIKNSYVKLTKSGKDSRRKDCSISIKGIRYLEGL